MSANIDQLVAAACNEPFADFVARVSPKFGAVPDHLAKVYRVISKSMRRQIFATVSLPPRHGKSETLAHGLAYRMVYTPTCLNGYATYGHDLSKAIAKKVRRYYAASGWRLKSSALLDLETSMAGGLKSTSTGGSITGRGFNGGIAACDDIIKGIIAARSRNERDNAMDWLQSDYMSRLESGASLVVMGTRWHEDDPIGRILRDPMGLKWKHINLPAIHDGHYNPIDERKEPDRAVPLWTGIDAANPTKAGALAWYAKIRARGEQFWWPLYQGMAGSPEGQMFTLEPPRYEAFDWAGKRGCIVIDPAATAKTTSDWSAIAVLAAEGQLESMKMYVVEMHRLHKTIPDVIAFAVELQERTGLPIVVESVGAFAGIPQMIRMIAPHVQLIEIHPMGDKKIRATPLSAGWQTGRVFFPYAEAPLLWTVDQRDWTSDCIDELHDFTGINDKHDDQVDCLAHGWNWFQAPAELALVAAGKVMSGEGLASDMFRVKDTGSGTSEHSSIWSGLIGLR